ncbi:MAG: hypothetical protein II972_01815 [Elusimicrobiaceae bacterium]|nr:hypothetical protein [Elusimicrobiaceae bacterium]
MVVIKLTLAGCGKKIKVPADKIESFRRAYFQQETEINLYTISVKESPEEIEKLIKESI